MLGALGCEDEPPREPDLTTPPRASLPPPESSARLAEALSRRVAEEWKELEAEAGREIVRDPPAPGGDLKSDLEAFTTLDACAREHRVADPVLADAIDAVGYDTLVRDACRTLQAIKAKDGQVCRPIAASPLRERCESLVAIVAGLPALCPVATSGSLQAREPVCLARASRDERLCAAAPLAERAACRALVRGRSADCGADQSCVRQVERYRGLIDKPASHAPLPARLHVSFTSGGGDGVPAQGAFDLDHLAQAGAVARPLGDKVRLSIGTPKGPLWPSWESPFASPQLFVALSLPAKMFAAMGAAGDAGATTMALAPSDLTLDLLIPRVASLSGTAASDRRLVVQKLAASSPGAIELTLKAKLADGRRSFDVTLDVDTFVRDGVDLAGPKRGAAP